MQAPTKKQLQIAGLIQQEFSRVLQREGSYIYGEALVTVTRVRMSQDMGIAYIYMSIYNALHKEVVIKDMEENMGRLRGALGKEIASQIRRIPTLKLFADDSLDNVAQLDNLFANLQNQYSSTRSMKDAQMEKSNESED